MKNYIFLSLLFFCISTNAQNWNNLTYNADQAKLENNPLKGFADLYGPTNNFPRSINGKLFGLNQVMNGLNNFNWTVIDNFIAQNKAEGNFSYIQVNIDPGPDGNNVPQSYMPAFLDGQYNSVTVTGSVADICPDWNDPQIIEAMLNFIAAFGAKYNNQPEIFMVHLGLYGIYGEWQIGAAANLEPDYEMTSENKIAIANAYKAAFPNTYLLARYPEHMPEPEKFGYSDGLFFSQSISDNTFFNHFYFDNTITLYNAAENWRSQVIGGEIDPCLQPEIWKIWPNNNSIDCDPDNPSGEEVDIQDVQESFEAIHPTFLFSHHIFTGIDPVTNMQEWNNAIMAQKMMGYTFYIDKYRLSASNGFPVVEVNIQNKGLAPMYANWDVEFAVLNFNNRFQLLGGSVKWDLNLIQPDALNNYRSFTSPTFLPNGNYKFLLRIKNPIETATNNAQPVRFANTTQDTNNIEGWLTLGQISINSGNAGVTPIAVNAMSLSPSNATLTVGDNLQLTTTVSPSNATNPSITWVSDKPGTASVDANGLVTAGPAYGTVKISAYTQDGGIERQSVLTVEPLSTTIPLFIEAEDYVRMKGIVPGFGKIGFIDNRDWMEYSVTVKSSANFIIDFVASSCPPCLGQLGALSQLSIIDENDDTLGVVIIPNTSDFNNFQIFSSNSISLPAGTFNLKIATNVGLFDLDKMLFRFDCTTQAVETTLDDGPGSLRQAIACNFNGEINLDASIANQTISLLSSIYLDKNLHILGVANDNVFIEKLNNAPAFIIEEGDTLILENLNILNTSNNFCELFETRGVLILRNVSMYYNNSACIYSNNQYSDSRVIIEGNSRIDFWQGN